MQHVELLVRLKIPDVTALTAAGALRRRMGYETQLKALKRADFYRLELDAADQEGAFALARELAEKTNVFVNPNKDVYEVRAPSHEAVNGDDGTYMVQVLVTDPSDGSAAGALSALKGRLGYGDRVGGILKGILWTLELECDSAQQAREIARDIAVTTRRESGLLMNPHFQECEVW